MPSEDDPAHPVAVLLSCHWEAVHDYAVICVASSGGVAPVVAAAAFHQVLERVARGESAEALRPRLLVVVRDTVRAWSAEQHITMLMPELRKPTGGRGMRTAKSITAENRKLARRSFRTLPGVAQCLLWHIEVEADPISVPAGLLGMDVHEASAALEQAREQFRAGCVRAHRELAPSKECRSYSRLLDVSIHRGDTLLPDVQQHLVECRYCRDAAEQLRYVEGAVGTLLAEAVLGWGARRYVESRPARVTRGLHAREPAGEGLWQPGTGGHRLRPRLADIRARVAPGGRQSKAFIGGVGLVAAALLAAVLTVSLVSDGDGPSGPAASTGATGSHSSTSAPPSGTPSAGPSADMSAGLPGTPIRTRLRNAAAGLCLDIRGGEAEAGADTKLAACSSGPNQQWSYEDNGLLRSLADPELCLDSRSADGLTTLSRCAGRPAARADDVRYDLTVQGELLPRWQSGLAVAPTSTHPDVDVVVKTRDGSAQQRWLLDSSTSAPVPKSIAKTPPPSGSLPPAVSLRRAVAAGAAPGRLPQLDAALAGAGSE
ncbi:RICIN domain-containing protein [Streptomyces sp. NPDC051320]|uniref:RICIN domain-containing protein n=1 Tax=Streptomyces sp. NPDC051320 TaxID=3154644 RepID=UPI003441A70C